MQVHLILQNWQNAAPVDHWAQSNNFDKEMMVTHLLHLFSSNFLKRSLFVYPTLVVSRCLG